MADPYCLAMVLCEAAHRDTATGKISILGTFSEFASSEYPAEVDFVVYYAVTDGSGESKLRIKLIRAGTGTPGTDDEDWIFEASAEVEFVSPLQVMEGFVDFKCNLPEPGLYHCELWADGSVLMSRRLLAIEHGVDDA